MDEEFIRNRITELRLKKGVSEYQMSMELGQNRSYIQAISSGRSMPSMKQFLNICEYFEITPLQFFDAQENNPQLIKKALDGMRKMSDDDLIIVNIYQTFLFAFRTKYWKVLQRSVCAYLCPRSAFTKRTVYPSAFVHTKFFGFLHFLCTFFPIFGNILSSHSHKKCAAH